MRNNHSRKPLFSIIMATYNRAHLLPRAINSVLNQSYQNFELIIINDGSTDDTDEVIESFKQDGRIVYHQFKENKGMLPARNKGFDLAKGEYIALLDSDDELLPEALETAADKFTELSSKGVGVIWFDDMDSTTGRVTGRGLDKDGYMSYEDHICDKVQGDFWVVIKKSVLGELRFDEEAWDTKLLWLRLYDKARFYHVARALYLVHREHGSTVTHDFRVVLKHKAKHLIARRTFLKEYGTEVKQNCPRVYGRSLAALGFYEIINGNKSEGRRALLESLRFSFSIQAIALTLLSYILSERQIAFLYTKLRDARYFMRGKSFRTLHM